MKHIMILAALILSLSCTLLQAESYDLRSYLGLVQEHSKDLLLAKKQVDMAGVNKKQAVSIALPKVALQAGYKRNLTDYYMYADFGDFGAALGMPSSGAPAKFKVNRTNEYNANVALQQTLFSPSVGSAIKAANQYQKLADYVYDAGEQAILSAAKKMFYQALLLEKFWHVNQTAEENAKENYENMKLKFENGVVSEFELLQAQVRWQNAIPQTAEAKRNHELMVNNLKNWAGIPAADSLSLDGQFTDVPPMPEEMELQTILQRRPDYMALTWEEKLRRTNVAAKKAAFLPTLTGTVAYAYSAQSDQFKLEQKNNLYFAGLNLSLPIFTGGYQTSEVQKAQIELAKTRIKIDKARDNINNEISNIYLRLKEADQRIQSAKTTLKAAEKAFSIAEQTARSGLTTQLQLKDARVGYDQAMMNTYAAAFDYLAAYYDWQLATGQADAM